jgi:hypothetical protein
MAFQHDTDGCPREKRSSQRPDIEVCIVNVNPQNQARSHWLVRQSMAARQGLMPAFARSAGQIWASNAN